MVGPLSDLFPRRARPVRTLHATGAAALSPQEFLDDQFGSGEDPAPMLLTGGCLAVARKWEAPGYLAASTQGANSIG